MFIVKDRDDQEMFRFDVQERFVPQLVDSEADINITHENQPNARPYLSWRETPSIFV